MVLIGFDEEVGARPARDFSSSPLWEGEVSVASSRSKASGRGLIRRSFFHPVEESRRWMYF
jgi:hypothetical protein